MTYKEILEKLEEIEGQLDDSFYSLPEWDGNSDGLKDDIERTILDEKKSENN